MRLFNLEGKPVLPLVSLNRRRPKMVRRDCHRITVPHFRVYGHGIPGKNFPSRCLVCKKVIQAGEDWESDSNFQYRVIRHTACIFSKSVR